MSDDADGRWHWFSQLGYGMDPQGNRVDSAEAYIEGVNAELADAEAKLSAAEADVGMFKTLLEMSQIEHASCHDEAAHYRRLELEAERDKQRDNAEQALFLAEGHKEALGRSEMLVRSQQGALSIAEAKLSAAKAERDNAEALRNLAWSQRFEAENARDAAEERLQVAVDGLPFALKYYSGDLSTTPHLCWQGDYDGVTNDELRKRVIAYLEALAALDAARDGTAPSAKA